jgi:hypothetical protein
LLIGKSRDNEALICQLQNWIGELPSYIKALFAQPRCES